MKRITITEKEEEIVVPSFEQMLKEFVYIGFIPERKVEERYIVVTHGPHKGLAVNCENNWAAITEQPKQDGTYYMFDSKEELYGWMSGA